MKVMPIVKGNQIANHKTMTLIKKGISKSVERL